VEAVPQDMSGDMADKSSVRSEFRQARAEFARGSGSRVRAALETHIQRLIRDLAVPGLQVAFYRPLKDEPQFALTPEREFFYPRLDGERLDLLRPHGPFLTNRYGIEEPDPAQSEPINPSKPMLVFCPAVAVDSRGVRLGMGKGYYDRFFSDHPSAIRAAVVYQIQVSRHPLRADSWDQPMDWIVTETMILRTAGRGSATGLHTAGRGAATSSHKKEENT